MNESLKANCTKTEKCRRNVHLQVRMNTLSVISTEKQIAASRSQVLVCLSFCIFCESADISMAQFGTGRCMDWSGLFLQAPLSG